MREFANLEDAMRESWAWDQPNPPGCRPARKDDGYDDALGEAGSREIGYGDGRDQPLRLE
jgi:hypothetical protein